MEDLIYAFIENLRTERHCAANTIAAYHVDLFQFFQFICMERPHLSSWARVDGLLLQGFVLHLRARAYSPASIARKVAALKSFYFYLLENRRIAGNPTENLGVPQLARQSAPPLSEEQIRKMIDLVPEASPKGIRDRAMFELMHSAGLRATEVITLPLQAVDPKSGTVRVEGADGSRTIGLGESALEALKSYLEKSRAALRAPVASGPLFVNARGEQMTRQGVWLIIKSYAKRAGVEGPITPQSLRHAFARRRLAQGERIQDLQRLLGHAHLSTTLAYSRQHENETR